MSTSNDSGRRPPAVLAALPASCPPDRPCVDGAEAPADLCDLHRLEFRAWQAFHGKTPDDQS